MYENQEHIEIQICRRPEALPTPNTSASKAPLKIDSLCCNIDCKNTQALGMQERWHDVDERHAGCCKLRGVARLEWMLGSAWLSEHMNCGVLLQRELRWAYRSR